MSDPVPFPANSRYVNTPTAELKTADGRTIVYLQRRFVPDPSEFVAVAVHRVTADDRIDRLAASYLGDPELFWRLADANGCLDPLELEEVGETLRLTLPQGMAGPSDA